MFNEFILFLAGISILLVATDTFVKLAKKISVAVRISPLIVGLTVVSIGTSLPELAVSVLASVRNDQGLAVGNIIGSNIVNVLLVLPAGILIGKLRIGTTKTQRSALIMIASTVLYLFLVQSRYPAYFSGLMLLFTAFFVTVAEYAWGINGRVHEDIKQFQKKRSYRLSLLDLMIILLSVFGIILGGIITVQSIENLSLITGFSTTVLGLSLTAAATSIPEFMTTVFSQELDDEKLTIGNLIGSQVYNLLLIGGILFFTVPKITLPGINWVFLVFSTLCFGAVVFYYRGRYINKLIGIVLLSLFLLYILSLALPV